MEDCHRNVINSNIEALIDNTDYYKFINACKQNALISGTMEKIIEENTSDEREKHRKLFIKLTKRGPAAFEKIIVILNDLKYTIAIQILRQRKGDEFISIKEKKISHGNNLNVNDMTLNNNYRNANNTSEGCMQSQPDGNSIDNSINDYTNELRPYDKPIKSSFNVKKSTKFFIIPKIDVFKMRTKNRGVLFMVNIIDFIHSTNPEKRRKGAEIDGERLLHLFNELGYTLFYEKNLTSKQFYHKLDLILNSTYTKETESFVMALMTHGNMVGDKDRVEFHDGSIESIQNILIHFQNDRCAHLVGKPKVFLLPFCRGDTSDYGVSRVQTDSIDEQQIRRAIPTLSDIYLAFATVPGFRTHRDPDDGSWYIQKFCEVFAQNAHDMDLDDMLKIIGKETNIIRTTDGRMQTSSGYGYGWHKKLYFHPGLYEDE